MRKPVLSEANLLDLIGRIYDAAVEPSLWGKFLDVLANSVGGDRAVLTFFDPHGRAGSVVSDIGLDPEAARLWMAHYASIDPWLVVGARRGTFRTGVVSPGQQIVPYRDLTRTEFFNDFACRFGIVHGLGAIVLKEAEVYGTVTVLRDEANAPFDESETVFVRQLVPHLQRALAIHRRIGAAGERQHSFQEALEHLTFGVVLLDADLRVVHVNGAGRTILAARDGIAVMSRRVVSTSRREGPALAELIRQCARRNVYGGQQRSRGFMLAPRPSGRKALVIFVTPLSVPPGSFDLVAPHVRPAVAVFIHDPETKHESLGERLQALYGLTPAEAAVAVALLEGDDLQHVADRLCVSRETAKTHLRRIFEKTSTRRQAEFVRVALAAGLFTID